MEGVVKVVFYQGVGMGIQKRLVLLALTLLGCSISSPAASRGSGKLVLKSAVALVLDQHTGETLVEKRAGATLPIASLTKLMTAMVVLDAHLDPKEMLTITNEDKDTLRHSRSRLPVGTQLPRSQALLLALLASENRAAHALGRTFPGGLAAFVKAMNEKATTLGLDQAHFVDPAGLSGSNVASAWDLVRILQSAYRYAEIRDFTTRPKFDLQTGRREIAFPNTNALVRNGRWNIGLSKTGFIDEAGQCLVMQAKLAQRSVFIILLDSWGKYTRLGDAIRIRQWLESRSNPKG
jgi:D-alanyl-D-alanine endopeptidase (penicillin-binding protein 7)